MSSRANVDDEESFVVVKNAWPQILRVWLVGADGTTRNIFGRTIPLSVKDGVLIVDAGRFGWDLTPRSAGARDLLEKAIFSVTALRVGVSTDCGRQWWWRRPEEPVIDWELRMAGFLVDDTLFVPELPGYSQVDSEQVAEWEREALALARSRRVGREADYAVRVCVRWSEWHPDRSWTAREIVWGRIFEIAADPGCVTRADSS